MGTGIGAALTSFSPGNTISSSAVNSNFASINSSGVSNDGGNVQTDGNGVITCTGLVIGSSEHIILGTSSTIQFTNGTTTNDTFYVETASGHTDIQCFGSGQIRFKASNGTTIAAINPSDHALAFADSNTALHDVVYVNTGSNELYIQMFGAGNMVFKDQNGNNMAHLDHSGNLVIKGSLTQNGTP